MTEQGSADREALVAREQEFYDAEKSSYKLMRRVIWRAIGEYDQTLDYTDYYDVAGKEVLDYGCGDGDAALQALEDGATRVTGFDISNAEIAEANQRAAELGVSDRATFKVADAHDLDLPDDAFDIIAGVSILHHLEVEPALREIRRVLRPGGRAVFVEPLLDNPLLKLFRLMTPGARTDDEHPFTPRDWELCGQVFPGFEHHERELVTIPLMPLNLITPRALARRLRPFFARLDAKILKRFPSLGRYARISILVLQ